MTQASLQNANGDFVIPSPEGATAAAASKPNITPTDFSITNAPGAKSAPISGYSWAMMYTDQLDKTKGTALVDLFYWLISTEGQGYAVNLHYAAIPDSVRHADTEKLQTLNYQGQALLKIPSSSG
jgi:ABC-type phosphate transport system substrate-binding protein